MTEHLQIVIADDNYLVREGTRQLLEASGEVTVQAAVGSAPELLDAVRRRCPDAGADRHPDAGAGRGQRRPGAGHGGHRRRARDQNVAAACRRRDLVAVRGRVLRVRAVPQRHRRPGVPAQGPRRRPGPAAQRAARGRGRRLGHRPSGGRCPGQPARPAAVLASGQAQSSGARRATRDGAGPRQRGHRPGAAPVGVLSREARQRDLHQAGPGQRAAGAPACRGRAHVPARRRPQPRQSPGG